MSIWIFNILDSDSEFQSRIESKRWPIFNKTSNRKRLAAGDQIVFYKAGSNGQKFLGNAVIKTGLKKETIFVYNLEMDMVSVWKTPVEANQVISKLDFIKNKNNWGSYFQGGVRLISEKDYLEIMNQVS